MVLSPLFHLSRIGFPCILSPGVYLATQSNQFLVIFELFVWGGFLTVLKVVQFLTCQSFDTFSEKERISFYYYTPILIKLLNLTWLRIWQFTTIPTYRNHPTPPPINISTQNLKKTSIICYSSGIWCFCGNVFLLLVFYYFNLWITIFWK
jgi:hypothetical protein